MLPSLAHPDAPATSLQDETGAWYDCNDGNFVVPLNPMDALMKATMTGAPAPTGPLPEIPNELGGIWAYIKWEQAGCPNRSQHESDEEYQRGLQELKMLLQEGVDMDTLWKVGAASFVRLPALHLIVLPGGRPCHTSCSITNLHGMGDVIYHFA